MINNVYVLNVNSLKFDYSKMFLELPAYCKNKINMCNNIDLKNIRIVAWYALYKILLLNYRIDLSNCNIYENKKGKPYIDDIYFNITHSKDYIGIIISEVECGIDIEKIELNVSVDKFAKKILSGEEYKVFLMEKDLDSLIKKWTKIETYYKIRGEGISFSNFKLEINDKDIYTIRLNNEYFLSYGPIMCEVVDLLNLDIF